VLLRRPQAAYRDPEEQRAYYDARTLQQLALVLEFVALALYYRALAAESGFGETDVRLGYHNELVLPAQARVFEEVAYGEHGHAAVLPWKQRLVNTGHAAVRARLSWSAFRFTQRCATGAAVAPGGRATRVRPGVLRYCIMASSCGILLCNSEDERPGVVV